MSATEQNTDKQTMGFQTEAKQLLQLMIHSLYSNKEIFLRELISNSSDAVDKLRFEAISKPELLESDSELQVRIAYDNDAKTLTISDNGIGMSHDEVINNLGTIAKSGTAQFMSQLTGDQQKDSQMIGQFGVGFYSAFIVADKVTVRTRRAGAASNEAVEWESSGEADFTITAIDKEARGTEIILHLKAEGEEFADGTRIRHVVKKYSDHLSIPIVMKSEPMPAMPNEDGETPEPEAPVDEVINDASALWTRSRSEVSDEEYQEFYRHVSHDYREPLAWSHNRVEGKLEYTSLLFLPSAAPFDLYQREANRGLKLYVQRTFIMDDAEQFLPLYMRFVKGVIDSNDLPLNVSREILQQNPTTDSIRGALVKRILDMLKKMAKNEPEKYATFWKEFGEVIKEGVGEDFANKEKVAELLRFSSTHSDNEEQTETLDGYIERMSEDQDTIYYIVAENFNTAKNSPHLEIFRKKGIEVVLLHNRIDEWMTSHLTEFKGKQLKDVSKGDLDLGSLDTEEDKQAQEALEKEHEDFTQRVKAVLADSVGEVRVSSRLTDSPACLVANEFDMGAQMRQIMEQAGQALPETKPNFELNPNHPLVAKLDQEADEERFADLSVVLLNQAQLASGNSLDDPAAYVARLNKLLLELSA